MVGFYRFLIVALAAVFCISWSWSPRQQFIDLFADVAVADMHAYKIPASIKIAQAIIETNWGNSILAKEANNYFGIKCKENWVGNTYQHKDDDVDKNGKIIPSCFRAYNSFFESARDHSNFLSNRKYYKELFSLSSTDYIGWANGLKKCGYATDPNYAKKLIHVIEQYDLYLYDRMTLYRD
jgi:flagellum-specific peptidoglycan hydrolase FlgJ